MLDDPVNVREYVLIILFYLYVCFLGGCMSLCVLSKTFLSLTFTRDHIIDSLLV